MKKLTEAIWALIDEIREFRQLIEEIIAEAIDAQGEGTTDES